MKTAIYPGTFDPITYGHIDVIKKSLKIFDKYKCKYAILHCVSTYPCDEKDLNLKAILTLKKSFKSKIGYSGHESSVSPSIVANLLGADIIERHITLDRSMWGTDQSASLEEKGIAQLTSILKKIPLMMGSGVKKPSNHEKKLISKFKYW